MITKVEIVDNTNTPLNYISSLEAFKNGTVFNFEKGVNIIIGKNGCGKSTLIKLMSKYLLCSENTKTILPNFNSIEGPLQLKDLFIDSFNVDLDDDDKDSNKDEKVLKDGVKVYSDYLSVVYNYLNNNTINDNFSDIAMITNYMEKSTMSTGESMISSLSNLFQSAFSNKEVEFPIKELINIEKSSNPLWSKRIKSLINYYVSNSIKIGKEDFEFTFLLDEPDRNLDITNIDQIYKILSIQKEMTQLICVIHNPILIYKLSKVGNINFIEMSKGYLNDIKSVIENL